MAGVLHGVRVEWPEWVREVMAEGRWSISPAELWIELVLTRITKNVAASAGPSFQPEVFLTDFTDNESARAAANKGDSSKQTMGVIAREMARDTSRGMVVRTFRVTTKENAAADAMSRTGGERAGAELAQRLGVPYVEHAITEADPAWSLIPRPSL